jgi:hypothetical protein
LSSSSRARVSSGGRAGLSNSLRAPLRLPAATMATFSAKRKIVKEAGKARARRGGPGLSREP